MCSLSEFKGDANGTVQWLILLIFVAFLQPVGCAEGLPWIALSPANPTAGQAVTLHLDGRKVGRINYVLAHVRFNDFLTKWLWASYPPARASCP